MTGWQNRQAGAGAVGTALFLVVLAYGVFVGIQYAPQFIESSSINRILDSVEGIHRADPVRSEQAIRGIIDNQLYVNQMTNLADAFEVHRVFGDYVVQVHYERKLNLIYDTVTIKYNKSVTLD